MRFPLSETEIDIATDAMLEKFGRTDEGARDEIKLWITTANAMFERGYAAGIEAATRYNLSQK